MEKAQQIQVIFLFHPLHHLLCRWSSSPSLQSISFFCHFQQLFYNSVSVTSLCTEFCNSVEDVEEVIKEKDEEEEEEDSTRKTVQTHLALNIGVPSIVLKWFEFPARVWASPLLAEKLIQFQEMAVASVRPR